MLSSGMGASEIISLTYQNFLNSISEYLETPLKEPLNRGNRIKIRHK